MLRPLSLSLGALLTGLNLVAAAPTDTPKAPNVILIVADDLGARDLGCTGSSFHRTPHLDQLASRSVRFTDAYSAAPVCSPSRAALLTGQYPARLHLTDWLPGRGDLPAQRLARPSIIGGLPPGIPTLGSVLHRAGYRTGHIGKWHLGAKGSSPLDHGFDENIGGDELGSPLSYFAPYRRGERSIPGLETAPDGEYLTDRLNEEAIKFVERNHDRPFFLQLSHYAVHIPLGAKPEQMEHFPRLTNKPGQQTNVIYAAMLESVDDGVGKLVACLSRLQIAERTVIIFTSDNGGLATLEGKNTPATNNGPFREGKGYLYEGGVRVPLIIHWPGHLAGATSSTPVHGVDLFATVCEIAGVKTTAPTDGQSLVPILNGQTPPVRSSIYWHYPHYSNQGGRPGSAVRQGDFKLIEFFDDQRRELFDVRNDPGEIKNLANSQPDRVAQMAKNLEEWRNGVSAQMMTPNSGYHPHTPNEQGVIEILGRHADVHGTTLRFEPLPHKNTVGFWVDAHDWVSWEFETTTPGSYEVLLTQGCGTGCGGSEVECRVADQAVRFIVKETGGFQNFEERSIGRLNIGAAGRHTLALRALHKPGPAVMDVPLIRLKPAP